MLSHLSAKFKQIPESMSHEPRAALILNRFTRTLTIMYATKAIFDILGISDEEAKGRSFYECIQENCLGEAVRCLESAKANDSIAYLRFWFRDPRQPDPNQHMDDQNSDDEAGVSLNEYPGSERNTSSSDQGRFSDQSRSNQSKPSAGRRSMSPSGNMANIG